MQSGCLKLETAVCLTVSGPFLFTLDNALLWIFWSDYSWLPSVIWRNTSASLLAFNRFSVSYGTQLFLLKCCSKLKPIIDKPITTTSLPKSATYLHICCSVTGPNWLIKYGALISLPSSNTQHLENSSDIQLDCLMHWHFSYLIWKQLLATAHFTFPNHISRLLTSLPTSV